MEGAVVDGGVRLIAGAKGDVEIGAVKASRPVAGADDAVAGMRPRLRQCYARGLDVEPNMSGKLALRVVVAADGEVTKASTISNEGLSADVAKCVASTFERAELTAPGKAARRWT